jgi:hypothetical protein
LTLLGPKNRQCGGFNVLPLPRRWLRCSCARSPLLSRHIIITFHSFHWHQLAPSSWLHTCQPDQTVVHPHPRTRSTPASREQPNSRDPTPTLSLFLEHNSSRAGRVVASSPLPTLRISVSISISVPISIPVSAPWQRLKSWRSDTHRSCSSCTPSSLHGTKETSPSPCKMQRAMSTKRP